jgi:uncharacterized protein (TIGR02996 family)
MDAFFRDVNRRLGEVERERLRDRPTMQDTRTIFEEERQLYRAILEVPHEDTPRLAMADWLDENGQPERAELIRIGVELASDLSARSASPSVEKLAQTISKDDVRREQIALTQLQSRIVKNTMRQRELLAVHGISLLLCGGKPRWDSRAGEPPVHVELESDPDAGAIVVDRLSLPAPEMIAGVDRGFFGRWTCSGKVWAEWGDRLRKTFPLVEVTLTGPVPYSHNDSEMFPRKFTIADRAVESPKSSPHAFTFQDMISLAEARWPGIDFKYRPYPGS